MSRTRDSLNVAKNSKLYFCIRSKWAMGNLGMCTQHQEKLGAGSSNLFLLHCSSAFYPRTNYLSYVHKSLIHVKPATQPPANHHPPLPFLCAPVVASSTFIKGVHSPPTTQPSEPNLYSHHKTFDRHPPTTTTIIQAFPRKKDSSRHPSKTKTKSPNHHIHNRKAQNSNPKRQHKYTHPNFILSHRS